MGNFQLYLLSGSEFHHLFLSWSTGIFSAHKYCVYYCWALMCPKVGLIFADSL